MVHARSNQATPPTPPQGPGGPSGGRLNLLLSYGGWEPECWVDRLPSLLEPMGVNSLRAQNGCQARHVIQSNRIHIAVVDLSLPLDEPSRCPGRCEPAPDLEEGGTRLLELLARLDQPPPVVAVKRARSTRDDARDLAAALRLGAFAVIDRPRESRDLEVVLNVLRRILERHYQGRWPAM